MKITGFKFKGIHSSEMGVGMKTASRPILPQKRRIPFEALGRDGVIDLSSDNEYGRPLYDERKINIKVYVSGKSIADTQLKLARVARWLDGSGELIFDDMPGVVWDASVFDIVDYVPEAHGKATLLSVSFICKPFSRTQFALGDEIPLGMDIPLGADIPLGKEPFTFNFNKETGIVQKTIYNPGTAPIRPIITLYGFLGMVIVAVNDKYINVEMFGEDDNGKGDKVIIDCDKCAVTSTYKQGAVSFEGGFPELVHGDNTIRITAQGITGEPCGAGKMLETNRKTAEEVTIPGYTSFPGDFTFQGYISVGSGCKIYKKSGVIETTIESGFIDFTIEKEWFPRRDITLLPGTIVFEGSTLPVNMNLVSEEDFTGSAEFTFKPNFLYGWEV